MPGGYRADIDRADGYGAACGDDGKIFIGKINLDLYRKGNGKAGRSARLYRFTESCCNRSLRFSFDAVLAIIILHKRPCRKRGASVRR